MQASCGSHERPGILFTRRTLVGGAILEAAAITGSHLALMRSLVVCPSPAAVSAAEEALSYALSRWFLEFEIAWGVFCTLFTLQAVMGSVIYVVSLFIFHCKIVKEGEKEKKIMMIDYGKESTDAGYSFLSHEEVWF